ncbi:uncharacterized protein LOC125493772 [Beta vulgaris subsp. vulgaris]|uniref:uncharacterized protein LOC125493772 n=1 Tax=Beta vulgaris subsp. vulgaris TaxID=3555 RepID=UPI002036B97D|nr:uncharacterized protein LOC125493772 [Beta vulgaris subsp. vulgaris]
MSKCLGIGVRPEFVAQRVRRIWNPKGGLEVIDVGHNVYFFKFSLQADFEKALFGGSWFILNPYLMLTRWKPNFLASTNALPNMSIWIRLPELPIEYYEKDDLFAIAKKVGKPITVDYSTNKITKGRFARICIKLSLINPLVTKVCVGAAWQRVQYENIGILCFACGKIGHLKDKCQLNRLKTVNMQLGATRKEWGHISLLEENSGSGNTIAMGEPRDTSREKICDNQSDAGKNLGKMQKLGDDMALAIGK